MRQLVLEIFIILSLLLLINQFVTLLNVTTSIYMREARLNFIKQVTLRLSKAVNDAAYAALEGRVTEVLHFRTEASDIYIGAGTGWYVSRGIQAGKVLPPDFTETFDSNPEIEAYIASDGSCAITFTPTPSGILLDGSQASPSSTLNLPAGLHHVVAKFSSTSITVDSSSSCRFFLVAAAQYADQSYVYFTYPFIGRTPIELVPYNGYISALNITAINEGAFINVTITPLQP